MIDSRTMCESHQPDADHCTRDHHRRCVGCVDAVVAVALDAFHLEPQSALIGQDDSVNACGCDSDACHPKRWMGMDFPGLAPRPVNVGKRLSCVCGFHRTTRFLRQAWYAFQRGFAMVSRTKTLKLATFNVNGISSRLPRLLSGCDGDEARRRLPAGAEGARRELPGRRRSRRPATARSGTARRAGTASPSWRAARIRSRTGAACPATRTTSTAATSRRRSDGIVVGCLYLPNGNPAPGPKFDYKLRWFERLHRARGSTCRQRRAGGPRRRLQRHADRARRL